MDEKHSLSDTGWLRASVLGANDGIVSTASLLLGVAAANASHSNLLASGLAALVAGAMSMATGEYVSVSAQADSESAALNQERRELSDNPHGERRELADIYVTRGLERPLATQVADRLMAHDALGSHARDELGLSPEMAAKPFQAAASSAVSFSLGAALPLLVAALVPAHIVVVCITVISLLCLLVLGAWSAYVGKAPPLRGALRVTLCSAFAMFLTWLVGYLFGRS